MVEFKDCFVVLVAGQYGRELSITVASAASGGVEAGEKRAELRISQESHLLFEGGYGHRSLKSLLDLLSPQPPDRNEEIHSTFIVADQSELEALMNDIIRRHRELTEDDDVDKLVDRDVGEVMDEVRGKLAYYAAKNGAN